jgi:hypothetical protein
MFRKHPKNTGKATDILTNIWTEKEIRPNLFGYILGVRFLQGSSKSFALFPPFLNLLSLLASPQTLLTQSFLS